MPHYSALYKFTTDTNIDTLGTFPVWCVVGLPVVNSCWHFGASPIHKQEKQVFWFIRGIAMLSRFTTPSKRVSKILHSLQNERPYGAGTNLKVGEGHTSGAKRRKEIFWLCPSTFLALQVQLVVLWAFSWWSVSCLLFFYSRCPRALWSRRHCCHQGDAVGSYSFHGISVLVFSFYCDVFMCAIANFKISEFITTLW